MTDPTSPAHPADRVIAAAGPAARAAWESFTAPGALAPTTRAAAVGLARQFLGWVDATGQRLTDVRPAAVESYLDRPDLGPATRKHYRWMLRRLLAALTDHGVLPPLPAVDVRSNSRPRATPPTDHVPDGPSGVMSLPAAAGEGTPEDLERFRRYARGEYERAAAAATGWAEVLRALDSLRGRTPSPPPPAVERPAGLTDQARMSLLVEEAVACLTVNGSMPTARRIQEWIAARRAELVPTNRQKMRQVLWGRRDLFAFAAEKGGWHLVYTAAGAVEPGRDE